MVFMSLIAINNDQGFKMGISYRLPDFSFTYDRDLYLREWGDLTSQVLQFFPGYSLDAFNPDLYFVKWEEQNTGESIAVDSFKLSVNCAKLLIENNRSGKI